MPPARAYRNRITYPNKFLDLGSTYLPQDIKELISLCRSFYYGSPIIRNIVDKLSEYPISDIILKTDDNVMNGEDLKKRYNKILDEKINLRKILLEVGLNYNVNGNIIVSLNQDFKRQLKCNVCENLNDGDTVETFKIKLVNKKIIYTGTCPKCGATHAVFEIKDVPLTGADAINLIFWNPLEVDVEYNPWNGKKKFLYNVPRSTRSRLLTGTSQKDKYFLLTIPKIYIDAIEKNKAIELDVYHFGTPELAQDKKGLNVPVVVSVLKDYWYYQTMRRAQEAVLGEHVVPFRTIFPQPIGAADPFTMMRMDKWKGVIKEQVDLWKRDPNHIMISPLPLGSQSVGGDAKYLLLTNELRLIEENIINGFGAPTELIKGGISYSGSSISLRILENHFLSFRRDLELLLNTFILPKISKIIGLPPVEARFSRLRMGDDQQFKQLMFQLVQAGYFSLETYLDEMGFDADHEKRVLEKEAEWFNRVKEVRGRGDAEAQAAALIITSRAQVKAQEAAMQENALIQVKQQQAAQQGGVAPNITELANTFLSLKNDQEKKSFIKQLKASYGPEVFQQLVQYLQAYSEQEPDPEKAEEAKDKVDKSDKKVESSPNGTAKARKEMETNDRTRASKKTANS